jgi:hypothetical protein
MALMAPRILKEPPLWKFSHLKYTVAFNILSMVEQVSTGVLCAWGPILFAAAFTSFRSGIIKERLYD